MKKTLSLLIWLLILAPQASATPSEPLPVIASFSILGNMVAEIGGDLVHVTTLVGPNGDAHVYEPTPSDVKRLSESKILFINGLGFEGWMERLTSAAQYKGKTIVASAGIKPRVMTEDEDGQAHTITDPHAWQDLRNGTVYADNIAAALSAAFPDETAIINGRAAAYKQKLMELNEKVRVAIASIPQNKRKIITSHDAFGYFGAAYGLTFMAPVGLSTEAEASAANMVALVQQIKKEGIKTIFLENMANPRLSKALARDAGAKIGGELYADALSDQTGPAPTYTAMFEHNLKLMTGAMQETTAH